MPNAILVVMVLAVGDVLCITHCHLLATVPGDETRCVGEGWLTLILGELGSAGIGHGAHRNAGPAGPPFTRRANTGVRTSQSQKNSRSIIIINFLASSSLSLDNF